MSDRYIVSDGKPMKLHQLTLDEALSFSEQAAKSNIEDQSPEELASDGMAASLRAAEEEWKVLAMERVRMLCEERETWSADDLEDIHNEKHPNSIGGIIQEAARRGYCRFSGKFIKSTIPRKHSRVIRIWESVI